MASVLVIEDDEAIRSVLARQLTDAGHAVRAEVSASSALTAVVDWRPEVIVLDLGLPDIDGREVLRMIRAVSDVPVIIATARDDEAEMIAVLDAGADDYVVKPYRSAQIEARIRAVLRRGIGEPSGSSATNVGDLEIDPARRVATFEGRPLDLSRLEFDLLAHLAARSPEVVTRRELLKAGQHSPA